MMTTPTDLFENLAQYYDAIMEEVDYDRWEVAAGAIAQLIPGRFLHMDAACGTGRLLRALETYKWRSIGVDLSLPMLRSAQKRKIKAALANTNFCALPFKGSIDYITCLFDSVNFLLELDAVRGAMRSFADALKPGGILYFDVVTERMVLEHFADQQWDEQNGKYATRWDCTYHRSTQTCETRIKVKRGPDVTLFERVYDVEDIAQAATDAGFTVLGMHDAETWRPVRKKTVRVDFVCVKGDAAALKKGYNAVVRQMRLCLK